MPHALTSSNTHILLGRCHCTTRFQGVGIRQKGDVRCVHHLRTVCLCRLTRYVCDSAASAGTGARGPFAPHHRFIFQTSLPRRYLVQAIDPSVAGEFGDLIGLIAHQKKIVMSRRLLRIKACFSPLALEHRLRGHQRIKRSSKYDLQSSSKFY